MASVVEVVGRDVLDSAIRKEALSVQGKIFLQMRLVRWS
jgi:hypothetical protein